MKTSLFRLIVLANSLALALSVYGQNLLTNGSFETPVIPAATYRAIPADQLAPWQTDGDNFEIWSDGMLVPSNVPTYSVHGRQNLEIQGGGASVWQTVSTVVGEHYRLSFYHSPRSTIHTTLTVSINSETVATFDENGTALSDFKWRKFESVYTATAASTTVMFSDSPLLGGGTHIDHVSLERADNLVTNGSFENPLLAANTYAHLAPSELAPWQTTDDTFEVWATSGAPEGTQHLEILSHAPSAMVFQAIPTEPGQDYTLSFYHSARALVQSTLIVAIDTHIVGTFEEDGSVLTTSFLWQRFQTNFTATSNSTTIKFADTSTAAAGTHIDDVSVRPYGTPAIATFTPKSGPAGTLVSITGKNFSTTAANNIVLFGGIRATVQSASSNSLVVVAPPGMTLAPVQVSVAGRTATSSDFFNPTFQGDFTATFGPEKTLPVGDFPDRVDVGDFNGDGIPDVACANVSSSVSVFFGTGDGNFSSRVDLQGGSGIMYGLAIGDFNGDGIGDLAEGEGGEVGNMVAVWLGSRTGAFSPRFDFPVGKWPNDVVAADFDNDGWTDLATVNGPDNSLTVLTGRGTGAFGARRDFQTGPGGTGTGHSLGIAAGDFNGDGNWDLAASTDDKSAGTLSVHLGDSTAVFALTTNLVIGDFPRDIVAGDFNNDGILDLATADSGADSLSVFLGAANGLWGSRAQFSVGDTPHGLAVGDFNGDGKPDLVNANRDGNSVSLLLGDGHGGFGRRADMAIDNGLPYSVAVGDFNMDGRPDIVTANAGDDTIAVFFNTTAPPLPTYSLSASSRGGGIVVPDPLRASYPSGTPVTLAATPAIGWEFLLWLGDAQSANPAVDIVMNGEKCLEGIFGTGLHTATSGSGLVTVSPAVELYPYGSTVRLVAMPAAGQYFTGWSGAAGGGSNPGSITVVNANDTVQATFAPLSAGEVSLTVVPEGFGRVSISPRANRYTSGQVVTLTASPEPGQLFSGWDDTASVVNPLVLTLNESVTVVAHFTKRPSLDIAACLAGARPEGFRLMIRSEFGVKYRIDRSSDLLAWEVADILTAPYGIAQYTDPRSLTAAYDAYRAVVVEAGSAANPDPAKFVWIPAGTFTMGSPANEVDREKNEGPQTQVTITSGFWMAKHEVMQREYSAVMGINPSRFTGDFDRPVESLTWENAINYCAKLTAKERVAGRLPAGWEYRLPTEAEWEFACRAGTTTATAFGNSLSSTQANFDGNKPYNGGAAGPWLERTTKVGSYSPSAWGLYDMHGNVWEWCLDWYADALPGDSVTDPKGPSVGSYRVLHGGSWISPGRLCRSAFRNKCEPSVSDGTVGFRVVLAPSQP